IGIYVESNNASVATGVFSNLSVSEVNPPATTFSFAAGSLSADAGEEVQVCVNIANPCACAPASVQVALQGNAAPHLSGFSTQTLQFQSGDMQKCFSLSTAAAPGDGSYTLILQNPTGGNDAAIGAQSALAVAVTAGNADGLPLGRAGQGDVPGGYHHHWLHSARLIKRTLLLLVATGKHGAAILCPNQSLAR
ncbi:MAG TPA: hypothetical protein PK198_19665, partial [Saprospiraceae bacterium]|nr:hypothetical protein [Saprospiraceae bacterium]